MRLCTTLALALGIVLLAGDTNETHAAKSAKGNEWNWASGYAKLHSTYGQFAINVAVKYVVTPAQTWTASRVDYVVATYANGDGTGWDADYEFNFTSNFSSEHLTNPIVVGNGAKFFKVKQNKCKFMKMAEFEFVELEDSGYVQFRD
jgi:hypothetical protein